MATNKRLSATITIGGAVAGSLRSAFGTTTKGLEKIGSTVKKLTDRQKELSRVIKEQEKLGTSGGALRVGYANQELSVINKQIAALRRKQQIIGRTREAQRANIERRGELRGKMFDAVVIGAAVASPIVQAAKFETAMLGVAKQVNGARDAGGKLTQVYYDMAKQIRVLGHELPIPTNEIAGLVTSAARMGIANDDLIEFTRTAAKMSTAFEMPAEELSDSMGKISTIFKLPIKSVEDLGDAINYLDDNAISKGGDIIKVMQGDLAGAATTMGMSAKNAAALASTFLTLGESAERADTAASGMLRQLQIAKMNPKKFQIGVKMLGMDSDQLQKGMIADPQKMILDVLGRIKKLPAEKKMEAVTRLFGKDWGGAIAKLANNIEEYQRQLALANGSAAKGSMQREFSARMDTTEAKWAVLTNQLKDLAVAIGDVLIPALKDAMGYIGPFFTGLADIAKEFPLTTKIIVGTLTAITGARLLALGGGFAFTFLKGGVLAAKGAAELALLPMAGLTGEIGKVPGAAAKAIGGIAGFIGKLGAVGLLSGIALDAARALGLPDTDKEKGNASVKKGDWWAASAQLPLMDFLGAAGKAITGSGDAATKPATAPLPFAETEGGAAIGGRRASGKTYQDNSQHTYHITQLPGESAEALARRVTAVQEKQRQVRERSQAYDGATP